MNSRRIATLAAVVLVAIVAGGIVYLRVLRPIPVPTVVAAQSSIASRVNGPGTLQARVPVTLSARITASVARLEVDVGDSVKRGQVLAHLDDRDLTARRGVVSGQQAALVANINVARAAVAKAHADLELAQSKERRDAELVRAGFVSQSALDGSEAALRAARANLESAHAALAAREAESRALGQELRYSDAVLSYTRLVAPMDGVVIQRQVEAGATVVPGSVIYRIVDPATLWIATRVDESVVGRVEVGQSARIKLRTGESLGGKVARIARQSDAATRELDVHVAFDSPPARFAIDQEADVTIETGMTSGIVLPLTALTRDREGRQGVLLVIEARARFRAVETGGTDGPRVLIAKGLLGGERVVTLPEGVKPNARVRALDGPAPSQVRAPHPSGG